MMIKRELAHTANATVYIPDRRFYLDRIPNGWRLEALRGYKYVQAVFDLDNECQGWVELGTVD